MMPVRQMAPPRTWASVNKTYPCEQATAAWCEQVPVPTPARENSHPPARAMVRPAIARVHPAAGPPPLAAGGPGRGPAGHRRGGVRRLITGLTRPGRGPPQRPGGSLQLRRCRGGLQLRRRLRWWGRDGQMRRQRDDLVDERHQQQHQDKEEPEQASVLHFGIPRRGPPSRWPAGLVVAAAAPPTRTNWSTRA